MRKRRADTTTIRATCQRCGDVTVTAEDVRVHMCAETEDGIYSFVCPTCAGVVIRDADRRIVDILRSGGVMVHSWSLPVLEAPADAPPISWDDVLEFHQGLSADDWLDDLIGS
jgi:hypothetical protein